jgi:hypothetical protein
MKALARRVRKLESSLTDASGLVPHSEAWFAFWEDKFERLPYDSDRAGQSAFLIFRDMGKPRFGAVTTASFLQGSRFSAELKSR